MHTHPVIEGAEYTVTGWYTAQNIVGLSLLQTLDNLHYTLFMDNANISGWLVTVPDMEQVTSSALNQQQQQ